ncbi:sugar ABC transporter substrate-binding protein [Microbacterium sp. zg-Y818]|uniref:sugar ABC transporter substrate-binding protein n=1 Tax=unclassified Microbacterium TaxID=2609290 RepID=UPI00214C77A6|nr:MULTISPECIES: sugar ABC transporter substrate-binding protein [unclassified Microbacterium]MCR2800129.1 sugar ABC transporter substrate-binding protein [Microbacterium sp. zg.Y818]WIM22100.1 sugar ABC transporter substrate-binding protein [Microbacterium sp. zg-Y818]
MMKNKYLLGGAVLAAAMLLTACAGSGDTGSGSSDGDASGAGKEICYITAAESHAYATPANEAFLAAADEAGAKVTMLSQDFDVQKGTEQLSTCVGRSPDGIVLWPLDPQAYIPGLIQAQSAQIPVVLINSPMDDEALELVASFTGPDVYEEGVLSADAMTDVLGAQGKVVIIAGQAGNGTSIGRSDGFTDRLEELGSEIEILQSVNADFDQQKALVASRDLITRFGDDIDGVYAADDTMARGFIDAWTESGRNLDDIPAIVGINGQADAFESIKAGHFYATILQSPVEDGALALTTILKVADGETVDARLPIPLTVVTIDNVDDIEPAF